MISLSSQKANLDYIFSWLIKSLCLCIVCYILLKLQWKEFTILCALYSHTTADHLQRDTMACQQTFCLRAVLQFSGALCLRWSMQSVKSSFTNPPYRRIARMDVGWSVVLWTLSPTKSMTHTHTKKVVTLEMAKLNKHDIISRPNKMCLCLSGMCCFDIRYVIYLF